MNILITGGAGFIGSSLADKLLSENHTVIVVDNFNDYYDVSIKENNVAHNLGNSRYKLYRTDIEDLESLQHIFNENNIDVVVHLAARAGVRPSLEKPIEYVKTNIMGTVNILECMRAKNINKIVFASSSSVYGNCPEDIFSEDLKVTEPISPYAATKSACEQLLYTWHHLYGISVVALRFFTVYGPRQRPDLAIHKFAKMIKNHQAIHMYGDGSTKRDYTFISDILSGICAAIDYDKTGFEIINLGGGEPITLRDMIHTIEQTIGTDAIIEQMPMQPGDVDKTVCDWSKAHKLLGYNPNTNFQTGIATFVDWFNSKR
ncbi:MAG: SDR family NAD(P)-dependent oxidoreductase [Alphaproteobacteria bacterium]|nr:SDR family NAD(P)-dependent oxidoreductase [Alphaproteobacteria bacterium]